MTNALELRSLFFRYSKETPPILRHLNLSLKSGERHLLLGAPESGKTTLLRILSLLAPRHTGGVLTGEILIEGRPINDLAPYQLIDRMGVVFQNSNEQLFLGSVTDEILFPLESLGLPPEQMERRLESALALAGIVHLRKRSPSSLSGGEKRRLLLATLFATAPPLWIFDGTLEELDAPFRRELFRLFRSQGSTVLVFSSKNHQEYQREGFSVSLLSGGALIKSDEPHFEESLHREGLLRPTRLLFPSKTTIRTQSESLLCARSLGFSYGRGEFSLEIEKFHICKGEVVALLGGNGSGKSTLGKLLCGLLPPSHGTIEKSGDKPLSLFTAYLFQNPDLQLFLPTVEEELLYALPKERQAAVEEILTLFSLPDRKSLPALLSYGTRRRLQVATYTLLDRELYILDETEVGLSFFHFLEIFQIVKKRSRAVILITHDEDCARALADRICVMERGKIQKEELL